jgi:tRNA(Ile)-lysidine synthase
MLEKVRKYMDAWHMLSGGDRVVVGISGGPDSVVLLHVLKRLREPLGIVLFGAHVNHGLRGEAAKGDAAFAEHLCRDWDIPFFLKESDVHVLSRTMRISEEEAGRIVRYDFFREVMEKVNGNRIATAHHKNDQAETILHHIIRGTGMQGLSGIKPVRDEYLIRPLLDVTRMEIEDYIQKNGLSYRVDATNTSTAYTRNRIRNELIPALIRDYNPGIVDGLAKLGSIVREEDDFLLQYCNKLYQEYSVQEAGRVDIDLKKFLSCHTAVQKRLVRLDLLQVRGNLDGIGYSHIESIVQIAAQSQTGSMTIIPRAADKTVGPEMLPVDAAIGETESVSSEKASAAVYVEKRYECLRFCVPDLPSIIAPFDVPLPVPGKIFLQELNLLVTAEKYHGKNGLAFSAGCIYINEKAVKGGLRIRQRRDGDRYKPFGMEGTKKLKDYFIDRKVPREERNRIPLLVDENNIIWVIGFQTNEDYKISASSTDILKISIQYTKQHGG